MNRLDTCLVALFSFGRSTEPPLCLALFRTSAGGPHQDRSDKIDQNGRVRRPSAARVNDTLRFIATTGGNARTRGILSARNDAKYADRVR
jgi:hypothetical protein